MDRLSVERALAGLLVGGLLGLGLNDLFKQAYKLNCQLNWKFILSNGPAPD